MKALLTREKGLLFRITHIDNLRWILGYGLHCRSSDVRDPGFHDIGSPELIAKRAGRVVPIPPGGTLSDYVAFYFTPFSPMLYNIKTGYGGMRQTPMPEIVILVSSVRRLAEHAVPFLLSDRHAYMEHAEFSAGELGMERIDWKILQERDFRRDFDDLGKIDRYQAEALAHRHVPVDALAGLVCHGAELKARIQPMLTERTGHLKLVADPSWYF